MMEKRACRTRETIGQITWRPSLRRGAPPAPTPSSTGFHCRAFISGEASCCRSLRPHRYQHRHRWPHPRPKANLSPCGSTMRCPPPWRHRGVARWYSPVVCAWKCRHCRIRNGWWPWVVPIKCCTDAPRLHPRSGLPVSPTH